MLIIIFSDSQQLFVGNLPHNCAEEELVELFTKYGKVGVEVVVMMQMTVLLVSRLLMSGSTRRLAVLMLLDEVVGMEKLPDL